MLGSATAFANQDDLAGQASWAQPSAAEVQETLTAWVKRSELPEEDATKVTAAWQANTTSDLLSRFAAAVATAHPSTHELLATCAVQTTKPYPDEPEWLWEEATDEVVAKNLRLYFARWLAQQHFYDETLRYTEGLQPADVVDPAALLFYRGVAAHGLLKRDEGLDALNLLLTNRKAIPQRFEILAGLMVSDLNQLKDESLDHIARRMGDVETRLGKGRANERIRDVEDGVIESLDKLIKELEDQQSSSSSSSAGGAQSSSPARDSMPAGGKGPGEVNKKRIGSSTGWGDLPPKQREEALQQIGEDFPSHYRDVIQEYFREVARQLSENPAP